MSSHTSAHLCMLLILFCLATFSAQLLSSRVENGRIVYSYASPSPSEIFKSARPPENMRKFTSLAVESVIKNMTASLKDKDLAALFENCFPNTLDTTVESYKLDGYHSDAFIVTGDIKAMWTRDSTNQVFPYLPFISKDNNLKQLLMGVLNRQVANVLLDPYANAYYNEDLTMIGQNINTGDSTFKVGYLGARMPAMSLRIHERKYELDSLCAFLKLSTGFFQYSNDSQYFVQNELSWTSAVETVLNTIEIQQRGTDEEENQLGYSYWFSRQTTAQTETLKDGGKFCSPSKRTGMAKTAFRPSDDACMYSFNVAQNAMCAVQLDKVALLIQAVPELSSKYSSLVARAKSLASQIHNGIQKHGIVVQHSTGKHVFAYEVDGYDSAYLMDDANVPSLLAMPYMGYVSKTDAVYLQTRKMLLSSSNPYYFEGSTIKGIGSPHTPYNWVWPMSVMVRGFTSTDDQEIMECLIMIKQASRDGFMHESVDRNGGAFSRVWFAWANGFFGEFILYLAQEKPHLLF